ncbi:uncharacterized protein IWZ02DRAFT_76012 [Phyllosticta citriasiana]|uniref:uncharacterized protein n=1 Tax=Phyllosticta citriasiana TaxID=595635 RepID=UPI0030FD74C1
MSAPCGFRPWPWPAVSFSRLKCAARSAMARRTLTDGENRCVQWMGWWLFFLFFFPSPSSSETISQPPSSWRLRLLARLYSLHFYTKICSACFLFYCFFVLLDSSLFTVELLLLFFFFSLFASLRLPLFFNLPPRAPDPLRLRDTALWRLPGPQHRPHGRAFGPFPLLSCTIVSKTSSHRFAALSFSLLFFSTVSAQCCTPSSLPTSCQPVLSTFSIHAATSFTSHRYATFASSESSQHPCSIPFVLAGANSRIRLVLERPYVSPKTYKSPPDALWNGMAAFPVASSVCGWRCLR